MAPCPFCHGDVEDDLVTYGGTCPRCFAEIPGEESPTDPGEAARKMQHAVDRSRARRRRLVPVLVAVMLLGGVGTYVALSRPKPVASIIDFDDASYQMADIQFKVYSEPEHELPSEDSLLQTQGDVPVREEGTRVAAKTSRRKSLSDFDIGGLGDDVELPTELQQKEIRADVRTTRRGGTDEDIGDLVAITHTSSAANSGGIQLGGLDVGIQRRAQKGVRLTDDDQIIEMLKRVMAAELPRLKGCYQRRLKVDETLKGRWVLSFDVTRDGLPDSVRVTGRETSDPELEKCVADKVAKWEFTPIRARQPVQKTLTFMPGY